MKRINRLFITGLLAVLPLVLTVYLLIWLLSGIEALFGQLLQLFLPASWYVPGMGVLLGIVLITLLGFVLQSWLAQRLQDWVDGLVKRFPVVGDVYEAIGEIINYLAGKEDVGTDQVVMVTLENNGVPMRLMGIVTKENFQEAPKGIADEGFVAVYLPMSYQIGGYTVYLPKSHITPIDMNKKSALTWTLMAGVTNNKKT